MTWGAWEGGSVSVPGPPEEGGSRWGGEEGGSVLVFWGDRPYPPEHMGFTC